MTKVKPIPDDYPRVIPYLTVDGASKAIEFYADVFGATERVRMPGPDGKIGHAELDVGDSVVMLADATPDMGNSTPAALGGTPVTLMVYVEDVDDVFSRAIAAGASADRPVEDMFYGDRCSAVTDPSGNTWSIATHKEDVAPQDMAKRAEAFLKQQHKAA